MITNLFRFWSIMFYAGIFKLCAFLKSRVVNIVSKMLPLLADFVPQTPYRGFAPTPHWWTSVPQTLWL